MRIGQGMGFVQLAWWSTCRDLSNVRFRERPDYIEREGVIAHVKGNVCLAVRLSHLPNLKKNTCGLRTEDAFLHVLRVEISHVCGKLVSDAIHSRASERASKVCLRK